MKSNQALAFAIILALSIFVMYTILNSADQSTIQSLQKPSHPPTTLPKWTGRGQWAIPFKVRYATAFVDEKGQLGPLSNYSPWYTSSQFSNPELENFAIPKDTLTTKIALVRHFEGEEPKIIAYLPIGTTKFIDSK
jgi:hypothetical protein